MSLCKEQKIGISAGLLGAGIYFTGLFSGYLIPIILTFYVLWFEENGWLRRTAVKAVSVMILFSMITLFVNLFPDFLGLSVVLLELLVLNFIILQ